MYILGAYDRCNDNSANDARAVNVDVLPYTHLWHERFGHLNFGALVRLPIMVKDMPQMHMPKKHVYEACLLGKTHCFAIPKDGKIGTSCKLFLVHSDVCGPMRAVSLSGFYYFVTFIDDFTK